MTDHCIFFLGTMWIQPFNFHTNGISYIFIKFLAHFFGIGSRQILMYVFWCWPVHKRGIIFCLSSSRQKHIAEAWNVTAVHTHIWESNTPLHLLNIDGLKCHTADLYPIMNRSPTLPGTPSDHIQSKTYQVTAPIKSSFITSLWEATHLAGSVYYSKQSSVVYNIEVVCRSVTQPDVRLWEFTRLYLQLPAGLFVPLDEGQFGAQASEVHVRQHVRSFSCHLVDRLKQTGWESLLKWKATNSCTDSPLRARPYQNNQLFFIRVVSDVESSDCFLEVFVSRVFCTPMNIHREYDESVTRID